MSLIGGNRMFSFCLLLVAATPVLSRDCPSPCTCQGTRVTCSGLNAFPASAFPESTEVISLSRAALPSIPVGAFNGLPHLRSVRLSEVSVQVVEPCAFNGLDNLQELSFQRVSIQEMRSYAISDLGGRVGQVRVEQSRVEVLEPLALHNVSSLASLLLSQVALGRLQTRAFNAVGQLESFTVENTIWERLNSDTFNLSSIGILTMGNVSITSSSCGVLASLRSHSDNVSLTQVTLPCACDDKALVRDARAHPEVYREVICSSPPSRRGQSVADVCENTPEEPGSTCPSQRVPRSRPTNCTAVRGSAAILKGSASLLMSLLSVALFLAL